MNIKDNSGGMLLFAIITAMVISFTCASLLMITLNQTAIIEREIKRKEALNLVRAGFEYAYDQLGRGLITSQGTINSPIPGVTIKINPAQPGDPAGINWGIEVGTTY